ncbi:hypothetical protein [Ruminococcus sp. Marseille-P6503]|uniref:hypothetical protein n=1 Tax=Ruminococcus sp. Marseille-P6503 TaxID=2364796 RepID=UPI000F535ABD|nr:hypothetical protein [Ruminococcus sp. Marseille-P6503]
MGSEKLPINTSPFIRTYPEYLFIDTIINNEFTNSDCIASIYIKDYDKSKWDFYIRKSGLCVENNTVKFYRRSFNISSARAFFRKVNNVNDTAVFHIEHQQYTNRWDCLLFFVDQNNSKDKLNYYPSMSFVFGRYCSGEMFAITNGEYHKIDGNDSYKLITWIKLCISEDDIAVYGSFDGILWRLICKCGNLGIYPRNNTKIGCVSCLLNNQYYKWLCNNFIQIKFNPNDECSMDYTDFIRKDYKNYYINPFLKCSYDNYNTLKKWYNGLWNYIVAGIQQKRYMEIKLNEYYIPGLQAYQKINYFHESLIYGYNDEHNSVYILSIYQGKPKALEVSYEYIQKAWLKSSIVTFEFCPNMDNYNLDIIHIYDRICDYLSSRNSSEDHQYISEINNGVFGLNIYKAIQSCSKMKSVFLSDVRAAFLIKEHKLCMITRFRYLKELGFIPQKEWKLIRSYLSKIVDISERILLLVMKNSTVESLDVQSRIWSALNNLYLYEKSCYSLFKAIFEVI